MGKVKAKRTRTFPVEKVKFLEEATDSTSIHIKETSERNEQTPDINPFKSKSTPSSSALTQFHSCTKRRNKLRKSKEFELSTRTHKFTYYGSDLTEVEFQSLVELITGEKEHSLETARHKILTDYKDLKDSLPTLDQLKNESKIKRGEGKPRAAKSFARQNDEMMQDIDTYQQVLNSDEYNSDPFNIINSQLQYRLQSGNL